ncbi:hypothetical protein [Mangrovicoccus ximenensis]|uniref:hypothetical protein n=1 Tax=Mangrovicoccus ximenensis TaxID=1911570 RepID=UPI001374F7B2|nr:hypothetical protein [Mangrovicoccus ximenensis]
MARTLIRNVPGQVQDAVFVGIGTVLPDSRTAQSEPAAPDIPMVPAKAREAGMAGLGTA